VRRLYRFADRVADAPVPKHVRRWLRPTLAPVCHVRPHVETLALGGKRVGAFADALFEPVAVERAWKAEWPSLGWHDDRQDWYRSFPSFQGLQ
jgi:hypothetical protein